MLSQASRPYIDASVPVLRAHGLAITSVFYQNMFTEHPELKNLFNMGNQAQGTQQQSLAAAVIAYAANINNTEALTPVINRIVHKHASLGIKPEHYPIVGRHLIGAIKETLGDAATEPLLDAWSEAYSLLADTLISQEKILYKNTPQPAGQLREVKVIQIRQESDLVRSYKLIPMDDNPLITFLPGQYISISVNFDDGTWQSRQYSLSDAPEKPYYRITVKREDGINGNPSGQVSNWLHENLKVNDSLLISPPFGDFTPSVNDDENLVLLSAGVGITPMISKLNHLLHTRPAQSVFFAHAARNKASHSHVIDIETALDGMPNLNVLTFYEDLSISEKTGKNIFRGEMQVTELPTWDRENAKVYLCGPTAFMDKQWKQLLAAGVPSNRIYREVFGPDLLTHLI